MSILDDDRALIGEDESGVLQGAYNFAHTMKPRTAPPHSRQSHHGKEKTLTREEITKLITEEVAKGLAKISITGPGVQGSNGKWVVNLPKLTATGSGACSGTSFNISLTVTAA